MKKILLILAALMCFSVTALADTALTWDDRPVVELVDLYQVSISGTVVADVAPNTWVIANVHDGLHNAAVRAHNAKGWGPWSDELSFSLPYVHNVPGKVEGLKIIDYTPPTP